MIGLLNLVTTALLVLIAVLLWKKKFKWASATFIVLIVYSAFQPSYMPKGDIKRSGVPAFEQSDSAISDRLSKPENLEDRNRKREELYEKGLDFLK